MNPARDSPHPEQFGPYEVYERLGMGGMASVYRAKKRGPAGFERTVALKRMLSHLTEDRGFIESFVREAKVASSLVHPNIAQVYDFGRIGGVFYIAMELVAGFDLRKMLRYANRSNEPIPLPVVLSILGEMCDALDYAHSFVDDTGLPLNIVHRDVSPSNIIVAHTGHAKVIDFGIAKASSRQLHTESGLVKGKLGYMAPEAAMGMQVGPASDVFSVGVVAWELVTALPLFSSRTDFETMRRLREEPVLPPSRHNVSCPPELDALILTALARDVEKRVTSARAFRAGLDNIAAQYNIQASARVVAEWMKRFAATDASARSATVPDPSRPRSPSGQSMPLPPTEARTAVSRPVRAGTTPPPLRRSSDDIQLATEIWGEDATRHPDVAAGPDFSAMAHDVLDQGIAGKLAHAHVYTPPPYNTGVPSLAQKAPSQPVAAPPQSHVAPSSGGYPQFGASSQVAPHTPTGARPAKSRKALLVVFAVLVPLAGAIAAVLVAKHSAPTPTASATLVFETEPAGSIVEIGGKSVGSGSPLETRLAPGVYSIAVRHDGYRTWTGSITVRDGERQPINIALEKSIVAVTEIIPTGDKVAPNPNTGTANNGTTNTDSTDTESTNTDTTAPNSNAATKVAAHDRGKHPDTRHHVVESPPVETPHLAATKAEAKRDSSKVDSNKADTNKADQTKDPTKIDPIKDVTRSDPTKDPTADPNKVTTKPLNDTKLEPVARTPVVAASAVSKVSGEVPVLRGSSGNGDVLAKMCIDESGKVTSAKIVKSPPEISADLQRALLGWRYAPYKNKDSKVSPVCFPLTLRVVLRN